MGRNDSDTKRCLSCSNAVGHCNHSFGYYRFCPKCVMLNDKTCPCPTCSNLKAAQRRRFANQNNFISNDFSYVQQILLMLRKDDLPLDMNLALSDFTTISTARERDVPVLTANHCSLTVDDLLVFGKMKPTNARKKGTETKYKWYPNKKNGRGFGDHIMSSAEKLLHKISII